VTELAPPPPLTTRSPAEIQADIDRAVAGLRALRARQAGAHFADRPGLAARIQALQDQLDRLYEEKRAAHVITGRAGRQHHGRPVNPVRTAPENRHATAARLVAGLFADPTG
jgi:hypothetical protein